MLTLSPYILDPHQASCLKNVTDTITELYLFALRPSENTTSNSVLTYALHVQCTHSTRSLDLEYPKPMSAHPSDSLNSGIEPSKSMVHIARSVISFPYNTAPSWDLHCFFLLELPKYITHLISLNFKKKGLFLSPISPNTPRMKSQVSSKGHGLVLRGSIQ